MSQILVNDLLNGQVRIQGHQQPVLLNFPSAEEILTQVTDNNNHILFSISNETDVDISFDCDEGIVFKPTRVTIPAHATHQYALSVYDVTNKLIHLVQHVPAVSQDYTF